MATSGVVGDFSRFELTTFETPDVPDLGVFVGHVHGFEQGGSAFIWNEFPPFEDGVVVPHQLYARLVGGEALFHQRIYCWFSEPGEAPPPFTGKPPLFVLGGGPAAPSQWVKFPVRQGDTGYWFAGEHLRPGESSWRRDTGVRHRFDRYQNGTLSTVVWEDAADADFNDLVMEVAVVFRRNYFRFIDLFELSEQEERVIREWLEADREKRDPPGRPRTEAGS